MAKTRKGEVPAEPQAKARDLAEPREGEAPAALGGNSPERLGGSLALPIAGAIRQNGSAGASPSLLRRPCARKARREPRPPACQSAGRGRDRIRNPRHFLLYRAGHAKFIEVGYVLHDSMDLRARVPREFLE
jgi:hypothetical protein